MPSEKVSLTLEEVFVEQAREAVGPRGLSAYVNEALRRQLQRDRLIAFLDETDRRYGAVAPEVKQEVRQSWPGNAPKRRRSA